MPARWYYAHDSTRLGPFSAEEMKALASSGEVGPEDTVWLEGVERGVLARKVKHLFSPPHAAPAAEVPAPPAGEAPEPGLAPAVARLDAAPLSVPHAPAAQPSEAPPAHTSAWHQGPARTGRASAGKGAVIVGQDGVNVKVRKKCTVCGYLDSSWVTMPIRAGTTKLIYFCVKCRKTRDVEVVGSLS